MAYDIFISYRRTDNKGYTTGTSIARSIKQQLELERYKDRIFFDYSNLHDEEFEKIILSAIEQSRIFILVLTQDAMMRCVNPNDWVRREIMHAQKCGLKIIPINPDNLFNGYPNKFPKELEIVRKIQHTTIHMDASFESDIRLLIEKRIEPALQNSNTPSKTSTTAGALVRIEADLDCHILRFGKEIATARADELEELRLPKGKHKLSFISLDEKSIHEDIMLTINDIEFEEYIEINLRERYDALKAEQEQQRKAEEAALKKAQEEKARQEAEKRRQAAEEARKKAVEKKRIEEEERLRKLEEEARKKAEEEKESAPTKEQLIEWYNAGLEEENRQKNSHFHVVHKYLKFYEKAAKGGYVEAQYRLGEYYNSPGFFEDFGNRLINSNARYWYEKAAEQGHALAQYKLGVYYYQFETYHVFSDRIINLLIKAAEQGVCKANTWLGVIYYKGEIVVKNYQLAYKYFRIAAEKNLAEAQFWLGLCYAQGDGVKQNERRAGEWFTKAAQQGLAEAQYMLGLYFECGTGVEKDIEEAKKWYQKAADQGNEDAKKALRKIGKSFFGRLFG